MSIHDGHRERLKERFAEHGLDSFDDLNALELLLFYAIPRRDTNPIAHELLNKFGNLEAVLNASERELTEVPGIGKNVAILLRLVPQIVKKSQVSKASEIKIIGNSTDAGKYLLPRFMNEKDEVVYMLCLDSKRSVICCLEMGRGVVNAVDTNIRRMVETALKHKATTVIIAHNHPSGFALPSREDDYFTGRLYKAMETIGIRLEDHLIIVGDDFVSLADSGVMSMYRY